MFIQKIVMNIHTSFVCNKENQQIKQIALLLHNTNRWISRKITPKERNQRGEKRSKGQCRKTVQEMTYVSLQMKGPPLSSKKDENNPPLKLFFPVLACRILVLQLGMEPRPSAVEAPCLKGPPGKFPTLKHVREKWTITEVKKKKKKLIRF